jgi:CBS domain containing-hemolysin-like protein
VVNEFGDTIGILTADDVLDSVFTVEPTRTSRLLNRKAIEQVEPEVWHVTGWTSLRRIARHFQLDLPPIKSVTLTGMVQESVQRLAAAGDTCHWGDFEIRVLEVPERGPLLAEFRRRADGEPAP